MMLDCSSEVGLKDIGMNAPLLDDGMDTSDNEEEEGMGDATNRDDDEENRMNVLDDAKVVVVL